MAIELKIPDIGENIEEIQVVKVLVSVGDSIVNDQPVLELETGKAVVEIPADQAGTIQEILVKEGESATVGQVFMRLTGSDAQPSAQPETATPDAAAPPAPEPPTTPASATTVPGPAPAPAPLHASTPVSSEKTVPAAPSVRRFAREIGIDIYTVTGTGPHDRISISDVKAHARRQSSAAAAGPATHESPPLPDFSRWGEIEVEKMSGVRHATARHVSLCWSQVPRVTHFDDADITKLETLRKQYADRAAKQGGKLTMAVMVVRTCAAALRKFPNFNASIDMANRQIIHKKYVNVGIAVATPRGLLVPVIRNVDQKNMVAIASEISDIAKRAREGKTAPEELQGGCFTVTNIGSIGGTHFTPIVNVPEVAILGMGRAVERLVMVDGKIESRVMLPLSLSYDHRLIDGADAARFLTWIVDAIQEPLVLSLEG